MQGMTVYLGRSAGHRNLGPSKMAMQLMRMPFGIESARGEKRLRRSYQLANLLTYGYAGYVNHIATNETFKNTLRKKHLVA